MCEVEERLVSIRVGHISMYVDRLYIHITVHHNRFLFK